MSLLHKNMLEEIVQYAQDCISGKIISGKKHMWACMRLLRDVQRMERAGEDFPYIWDEEEARKIVLWFSYLKHKKGVLAGKPICLTVWQKFSLCQLYGWRHRETGRRRFKKYFKEVGRKNAKSQEEAGVLLYEIGPVSVKNGEICETYCAGTKRDQSKIIFEEAKNMLRGSVLAKKYKVTRDRIVHRKTGSFLRPLCKEDGQKGDGTNPAVLVLDEYHQHQTTEFYDLGLGANSKEPLLMIITTAGMDLSYPCYTEEYQYCSNILDPEKDVENEEYFVDICEIDGEQDVEDEKAWEKANPIRMSYQDGREKLRGEYEIARQIPEKMVAFLTKCMNMWVMQKDNGYMDMGKWNKCIVPKVQRQLKGCSVYVGFDMSAKIDLTSVAFILPIQMDEVDSSGKRVVKYILFSHSFVPSMVKLRERELMDKQPYVSWWKRGYITVTNTEIVDQSQVMQYVQQVCREREWKIEVLCFDPANASKLMMDLSNEGYDVEEVFQSYKSLNESSAGFREQVYCGNVEVEYNPVLTYAMGNAVVRTNNGLIKIDKDANKKRVDPVDATLCAFKLAMYHEFGGNTDVDEWLEKAW